MKRVCSTVSLVFGAASTLLWPFAMAAWSQEANGGKKPQGPVPTVFDNFSDGRYEKRTGKDPWGRPLPEWKVGTDRGGYKGGTVEVVSGSVRHSGGEACGMSLPSSVQVGTWKLRYRWPNGAPGNTYAREIGWYFIESSNGEIRWLNPEDGHWWIDSSNPKVPGRIPNGYYIVNMVGSQIDPKLVTGKEWHSVTIIRDADGYIYSWLDGKFVRWSLGRNDDIKDCHHMELWFANLKGDLAQYPVEVDDIEVYDGVYLPPDESIRYAAAAKQIVANGFDVTLEKIAKAVNDPSVFAYDSATRTATCHADLMLEPGARLVMENSTLKMACGAPGERKIKFGNDVTIRLNKATLTTTGDAPFSFEGVGEDVSTFKGILWVKDSTIDNFSGLSIRGVHTLHLEDSRFTRLAGAINFNFVVPVQDLTVRGCVFEGKTGNEAVMFFGGDQFGELKPEPVGMDFVDCDFSKVDFRRQSAGGYYLCPGIKGGTANAVNCRFGMLGFDGTILRHKYYLDVLAVDKDGKPVEGATVTVVNEQDNEKDVRDIVMDVGLEERSAAKSEQDNVRYPAENLMTGQKYIYVSAQASPDGKPYFVGQKNWFKGRAKVNVLRETKTGADGHTPPPRDTAKTLVLVSLVQTTSIKPLSRKPDKETAYTYTVRVETADGRKGEVKGVKPDVSWHRAKPNEFQNTVKVVVR